MDDSRFKHYVVHGDPIALARGRFSRQGKVYDAQKHVKLVWGIDVRNQHGEDPFFEGPLLMDVIFYLPLPQKSIKLKGQYHTYKPDSTNLLKFAEDVATSICYHDDCIISKIMMEKVYDDGNGPRTEFILRELIGRRENRELK